MITTHPAVFVVSTCLSAAKFALQFKQCNINSTVQFISTSCLFFSFASRCKKFWTMYRKRKHPRIQYSIYALQSQKTTETSKTAIPSTPLWFAHWLTGQRPRDAHSERRAWCIILLQSQRLSGPEHNNCAAWRPHNLCGHWQGSTLFDEQCIDSSSRWKRNNKANSKGFAGREHAKSKSCAPSCRKWLCREE